jgi:DNA (cytosine-5)-methyltransferase 1
VRVNQIRAIELFGCAGGMADGFRQAGLQFEFAFDRDPDACASYTANLGRAPIEMDVRSLSRLIGQGWLPRNKIDLLVADPPCTPWSRSGKRQGLADHRDMLAETCLLISKLRPRYWLIGNVPGLDDATNWETVQAVIGGIDGYCIDYLKLDAADYGVPQHRLRPVWFGHPFGTAHLSYPRPTHCDPRERDTLHIPGYEMSPWVTVRQALEHLPLSDLGTPIRVRWNNKSHEPSQLDVPGKVVPASQPGNRGAVLSIDHRMSGPNEPAKTLTMNTHGDGALLELPRTNAPWALLRNSKHPINRANEPAFTITARDTGGAQGGRSLEWPWDRPSTTVTSRDSIPKFGRNGRNAWETQSANAIKLSERAASLLQGFPDGWKFVGKTKRSRWAQIGQAMPPPLAHALARGIVRIICAHDRREGRA